MDLYGKPSVKEAIDWLRGKHVDLATRSEESPIFILSAGWNSGNLALQRMLRSHALIWGEPYGIGWPLDSLADHVRAMRSALPKKLDGTESDSPETSFPRLEDQLAAQQELIRELFAVPALRTGAKRWGIAEVRWSGEHAVYLHWLFPRAKFIFLYRDPHKAFEEYFQNGQSWLIKNRHPLTASSFARHWAELVQSFEHCSPLVEGLAVSLRSFVRKHSVVWRAEVTR